MEMNAKYKKYYDKLKDVDLQPKGQTVQTACETTGNTITSFSSALTTEGWKELGVATMKTSVVPKLQEWNNTLKSNIEVLVKACAAAGELKTELEKLEKLVNEYNEIKQSDYQKTVTKTGSDGQTKTVQEDDVEAFNEARNKKETEIKSQESVCDAKISEIKAMEGNIKDITVEISFEEEKVDETTGETTTTTMTKKLDLKDFVFFSQGDPRWGRKQYGSHNIYSRSACGPTAAAMCIRYLTGDPKVDPYVIGTYSANHGYRVSNGTDDKLFEAVAKEYGVKCERMTQSADNIVRELKKGKVIVAHMGPGTFTGRGHFIVLKGLTSDGKVVVADPNGGKRNGAWSAAKIAKERKGGGMFAYSI